MPVMLKASDLKAAAEQLANVDPALSDVLVRHVCFATGVWFGDFD